MKPRIETCPGTGLPVLVWSLPAGSTVISSSAAGGGLGGRSWVLNAQVERDFDGDPVEVAGTAASDLRLRGTGAVLLTAADVTDGVTTSADGVEVTATVGLTLPTWAASSDAGEPRPVTGTINVVAFVPVRLSDAALVNSIATVAEAKAQALLDLGIPGTGTASDAACVVCPGSGPAEAYGGPRSRWGAPLARAVHAAVVEGGR